MSSRSGSKRKIRYAVVGLGHIAQVAVLPAFKNVGNSELVAIVSGNNDKLKKLARKYRLENVYSYDEYDRALEHVDAVYIPCQTISIASMRCEPPKPECTYCARSRWL